MGGGLFFGAVGEFYLLFTASDAIRARFAAEAACLSSCSDKSCGHT